MIFIVLFFILAVKTLSQKSLDLLIIYDSNNEKKITKSEIVNSSVKVEIEEDIIHIGIKTGIDSAEKISRGDEFFPIIPKNTHFSADAKVPSLTFVDADVMNAFVDNLIVCLRVECDITSGFSELCIV